MARLDNRLLGTPQTAHEGTDGILRSQQVRDQRCRDGTETHTRGLAMQLSQGQDHQPLAPEGAPRVADVRLSQDRRCALESGTVRVL